MAGLSQVELDALCTSDHSDDGSNHGDECSPLTSVAEVHRVKRVRSLSAKKVMLSATADGEKMRPNYTLKALPFLEAVSTERMHQLLQTKGLSQQELDALCVDKDLAASRAPSQANIDACGSCLPTVNEESPVEGEQAADASPLSQAELDELCVVADGSDGEGVLDDGGDDKVLCLRKRTRAYDREAYARACQYVGATPQQGYDEQDSGDEEVLLRIRRTRGFLGEEEAAALSKKYMGMQKDGSNADTSLAEETPAPSTEAEPSAKETAPKNGRDAIQTAIERLIPTPQRNRIRRERASAKAQALGLLVQ